MLRPCRTGPLIGMFETKKSSTREENNFKGGISCLARWVEDTFYEVSGLEITNAETTCSAFPWHIP